MINILNNLYKFKEKKNFLNEAPRVISESQLLRKRKKNFCSFVYNLNNFSKKNPNLLFKGAPYLFKGFSVKETEDILTLSSLSRKGFEYLNEMPQNNNSFLYTQKRENKNTEQIRSHGSILPVTRQNPTDQSSLSYKRIGEDSDRTTYHSPSFSVTRGTDTSLTVALSLTRKAVTQKEGNVPQSINVAPSATADTAAVTAPAAPAAPSAPNLKKTFFKPKMKKEWRNTENGRPEVGVASLSSFSESTKSGGNGVQTARKVFGKVLTEGETIPLTRPLTRPLMRVKDINFSSEPNKKTHSALRDFRFSELGNIGSPSTDNSPHRSLAPVYAKTGKGWSDSTAPYGLIPPLKGPLKRTEGGVRGDANVNKNILFNKPANAKKGNISPKNSRTFSTMSINLDKNRDHQSPYFDFLNGKNKNRGLLGKSLASAYANAEKGVLPVADATHTYPLTREMKKAKASPLNNLSQQEKRALPSFQSKPALPNTSTRFNKWIRTEQNGESKRLPFNYGKNSGYYNRWTREGSNNFSNQRHEQFGEKRSTFTPIIRSLEVQEMNNSQNLTNDKRWLGSRPTERLKVNSVLIPNRRSLAETNLNRTGLAPDHSAAGHGLPKGHVGREKSLAYSRTAKFLKKTGGSGSTGLGLLRNKTAVVRDKKIINPNLYLTRFRGSIDWRENTKKGNRFQRQFENQSLTVRGSSSLGANLNKRNEDISLLKQIKASHSQHKTFLKKLSNYNLAVSDFTLFKNINEIRKLIDSKYSFDLFLASSKTVDYSFNKSKKSIDFNSLYKFLNSFFSSLSALISKPIYINSPDKISIRLFYYLMPNKLFLKKEKIKNYLFKKYSKKIKKMNLKISKKLIIKFQIKSFLAKWKESNNLIRLPYLSDSIHNFNLQYKDSITIQPSFFLKETKPILLNSIKPRNAHVRICDSGTFDSESMELFNMRAKIGALLKAQGEEVSLTKELTQSNLSKTLNLNNGQITDVNILQLRANQLANFILKEAIKPYTTHPSFFSVAEEDVSPNVAPLPAEENKKNLTLISTDSRETTQTGSNSVRISGSGGERATPLHLFSVSGRVSGRESSNNTLPQHTDAQSQSTANGTANGTANASANEIKGLSDYTNKTAEEESSLVLNIIPSSIPVLFKFLTHNNQSSDVSYDLPANSKDDTITKWVQDIVSERAKVNLQTYHNNLKTVNEAVTVENNLSAKTLSLAPTSLNPASFPLNTSAFNNNNPNAISSQLSKESDRFSKGFKDGIGGYQTDITQVHSGVGVTAHAFGSREEVSAKEQPRFDIKDSDFLSNLGKLSSNTHFSLIKLADNEIFKNGFNSLQLLKFRENEVSTMISSNERIVQYLVFSLEKLFKKEVVVDIKRIKYPYHDSNILSQILEMSSYRMNFRNMVKKIFYTAIIKNRTMETTTQSLVPSFLAGIKVRLAGRIATQRAIPRFTVQTFQMGCRARGKVHYVETSRVINKSKRGSFSFTVTTSHLFENKKTQNQKNKK